MIYKAPKSQKESGRIGWWTLCVHYVRKKHPLTFFISPWKM